MNGHRLKPIVAAVASAVAAFGVHAQVPPPAALPAGGRVVAGQAAIIQSGSNMLIQQDSAKAILNWSSFNIGSQASVVFQQPSSSAIALNRVLGADPSAIYGSLRANGQVFLINPSGVVFGAGARVDVGGLVASTLNIRDEDFLAGIYRFGRDGATGSVLNQGELLGKYVALLAPEVRNEGVIVARQGTAALAAGDVVTLSLTGNELVGVQVDKASIDTLVQNGRLIQAEAGMVILSAQSARGLVGKVVNTDAIEAKGITTDGGVVRLVASSAIEHRGSIVADAGQNGKGGEVTLIADLANPDSRTTVAGSISARGGSESGDGGFVETSASRLKVEDRARIDTSAPQGRSGQWLLDPYDFTIAASNGDISGSALSTALNANDVTIQTLVGSVSCTGAACDTGDSGGNGDIFVNDSVSWSGNHKLTLSAHRSVVINAPLTASGGAGSGVAIEFGQGLALADPPPMGGESFDVRAPINLSAASSFSVKFRSNGPTDVYSVLSTEAALRGITDMNGKYALGANIDASGDIWAPIGTDVAPFAGIFDGLGHTVSGINRDNGNESNVGMFGSIDFTGVVTNLTLTGVNVAGMNNVGALAGQNAGLVRRVRASGVVTGQDVSGPTDDDFVVAIGGLVGFNQGTIAESSSSVNVTATSGDQATFAGSGASGGIGGLVGVHDAFVGGLIDVFATGSVSGLNNVGGLVGYANSGIANAYSTGAVTNNGSGGDVGGLVGAVGPIVNVAPGLFLETYWDTQTSGQATSAGAGLNQSTGFTTAQMKTAANFALWDTTRVWKIEDGSYPVFITGPSGTVTTIYVRLTNSGSIYGDVPSFTWDYFTDAAAGTSVTDANPTGTATWLNAPSATSAATTYSLTYNGGITLGNAGYSLVAGAAVTWTVSPRPITVTADGKTKVYGEVDPALTSQITAGNLVNGDSLSGSLLRAAGSNVGSYAINQGTLAAGGNYDLTYVGANLSITPATLTLTGTRTYDATTAVAGGVLTANGVLGESFAVTGTGTLASKDVGTRAVLSLDTLALGTGSGGALAGNYNALSAAGSAVVVTKADLAVTGLAASSKVYDTTTAAVLTGTASITALGGDVVSLDGTATGTFADKNVGTGKTVTVTGNSISGADAGNYNLVQQAGLTANIAKADLSVTGLAASDKVYDGTTTAALTGTATVTALGADVVTVGGTATGAFANKNAGTGKAVTVSGNTLSGTDAGNYNIVQQAGLTADITPKPLDITVSRPYDTTDQFTTGFSFGGVVSGDAAPTVTGGAATVASKNNGTYNAFTSNTLALSDTNYSATGGAVNATISKKALTLLGLTAQDKTSDGSTAATLTGTPSLGGVLGGEAVTLTGTPVGAFADATVGTGKTVNVTGLTLAGADAANYTLTAALVANITAGGTSTTVANVVNAASNPLGPTTTTASFGPTTTTAFSASPTTTTRPQTTTTRPTTTTTAPPPAQLSGTTSNPTPWPGQAVPVRVPSSGGSPAMDATRPIAAVLVPASGDAADLPAPTPTVTTNADGTLSISVTVPPATPPGVYMIAIVGTDANGRSRTVIVPVVVRRVVSAS